LDELISVIRDKEQDLTRREEALNDEARDWEKALADYAKLTGASSDSDDPIEILETFVVAKDSLKIESRELNARARQLDSEADTIELETASLAQDKAAFSEQKDRDAARRKQFKEEFDDKVREQASKLRVLKKENKALEQELDDAERRVRKFERQLSKQQNGADIFDWAFRNPGEEQGLFLPDVVTVGEGPVAWEGFDAFLMGQGVNVYAAGSEDVSIMIVGRKGWEETELEQQIAAREGQELKVYSQEMALMSLFASNDIFDSAEEKDLLKLAKGHPALEYLIESELSWPLYDLEVLPDEFIPSAFDLEAQDESPLKRIGYTVGKTKGLSERRRDSILKRAFEEPLPHVNGDQYMKEWGRPKTRRRLWRMSNHIAYLARRAAKNPSMSYAVADWKRDLDMMEGKFYEDWMRFNWPAAKVPGVARKKVRRR